MKNVLLMSYDFDAEWAMPYLKEILKPQMKVSIITMSHGAEIPDEATWERLYGSGGEISEIFARAFGAYGIPREQISYVSWFHHSPEDALKLVGEAQVIFMTGGLPDLLIERMEFMGLVDWIQDYDGIVMGCSAGAMVQMTEYHITPDDDYDSYGYYPGLGLLDGFELEVHYCASPVQLESIALYQTQRHKPVYAITNDGGMLIDDGSNITLMGDLTLFPEDFL